LTSRITVLKALAALSIGLGSDKIEKMNIEQWLEFASTTVLREIRDTKDLDHVFSPLQVELAKKTFISGGKAPSIADWSLFSLLFPKIVQFHGKDG
jgi:hypothetical protein